jgi:hypothetical protein
MTILLTDSAGNLKPTGTIVEIVSYNEKLGCWRYANQCSTRIAGNVPAGGGGRDFMSTNPVPDYWFSANPVHVKKALKINAATRKAREKAAKTQAADEVRRMKGFLHEFTILRAKYGAEIRATQVSGDDQGVEIAIEIAIGNTCKFFAD